MTGAAFLSTRSIRRSAAFAGLLFCPLTSPSIFTGWPKPVLTRNNDEKANEMRRYCENINVKGIETLGLLLVKRKKLTAACSRRRAAAGWLRQVLLEHNAKQDKVL